MYCRNCGAHVTDGAKFCSSCGAQQATAVPSVSTELLCPFCGVKLELDSVFCDECGHKISGVGKQIQTEKTKNPKNGNQNRKLPSVISLSVLSVLLVLVIASVIWKTSTDKPKNSRIKNTETGVTETRRRRDTELSDPAEVTESKENRESVTNEKPTSASESSELPVTGQTGDPEIKHDPAGYQTSDMSKMADFQWITYEIMYGNVPDDVELLTDAYEISGGWKAYIVDDYSGENSVYIERLCNCYISGSSQDLEVVIQWDYLFNGASNESYSEKDNPDSFFNGSLSDGSLYATGAGSIYIRGFWYKDGKEYALGTMTWVDGLTSTVYLVRP